MKKLIKVGILISIVLLNLISCKKENDLFTTEASDNQSITSARIFVDNPGENMDIKPNIEKAYNIAKDGDILILPEGNFAFIGYLRMEKKISIKGAGINKTLLYRPDTVDVNFLPMLKFVNYDDMPSGIEISGIYFKSQSPDKSTAIDQGIQMYNVLDFVIHDCKFENFGEEGIRVIHKDNLARGLIYKCEFYHNYKGNGLGYAYGIAVTGENKTWIASPKFGTSNFIFIEDNLFEYHKHSITSGMGGLSVVRYNKILNNIVGAGAIDMHEARNIDEFSSRAGEIYNNTIINTKFELLWGIGDIAPGINPNFLVDCAVLVRGGEALVYNNYTEGFRQGLNICAEVYLSGAYPIKAQIGYNSALVYGENGTGNNSSYGDGDLFAWNNKNTVYECPIPTPWFKNNSPNVLVEGRDYHFSAKPGYTPYPYPHPLRKK